MSIINIIIIIIIIINIINNNNNIIIIIVIIISVIIIIYLQRIRPYIAGPRYLFVFGPKAMTDVR